MRDSFDPAMALPVLAQTPTTLRSLLGDLPDAWLRGNEGPDTWSPIQVVAHMLDADETNWMPRARVILAQASDRRFPPFDRFRHLTGGRAGRGLGSLLDEFEALRAANLAELGAVSLDPERLALEGTHPEFGSVTLAQLLATWVVHDLGHLTQITRVMARQYEDAVGPWRAYLSVLDR